jgi:hypothetical protein
MNSSHTSLFYNLMQFLVLSDLMGLTAHMGQARKY